MTSAGQQNHTSGFDTFTKPSVQDDIPFEDDDLADLGRFPKDLTGDEKSDADKLRQRSVNIFNKSRNQPIPLRNRRGMNRDRSHPDFVNIVQNANAAYLREINMYNVSFSNPISDR